MTPAKLLSYLDKMELSFRTADALARQSVLAALPPLVVGGDGSAGNTQYGAGDGPFILAMSGGIAQVIAEASPDNINNGIYQPFFGALDTYFASNTAAQTVAGKAVTALDLYASYQNGAALDSFLIGPNTARLYWISRKSSARGTTLSGQRFRAPNDFWRGDGRRGRGPGLRSRAGPQQHPGRQRGQ